MRPSWFLLIALVLVTVAVTAGWGFFRVHQGRQFRADLILATRDLDAGRLASARTRLVALTARRPADGEAAYRLGLCEEARGSTPAALECWARVPPDSPFAVKAAIRRARFFIDAGKLAAVEETLLPLQRRAGPDAAELRQVLELAYRFEGRIGDVRALIVESWSHAPDPALVLRRLWVLDHSAFPVGVVSALLKGGDDQDDRVVLGRANLAIMNGRLDEAARCLDICRTRRPGDPAVWRATLELGRASHDPSTVWRAVEHLPADVLSEGETLRLRAWFAAREGSSENELKALRAVVSEEPGNTAARDRMAELALARGDAREAERLRRRKLEVNTLAARYKELIERDGRAKSAGDLGRIAGLLGRRVEARGWELIRADSSSREPFVIVEDAGATLAEQLADLKPKEGPPSTVRSDGTSADTPEFSDDAERAGLSFVYDNGHSGRKQPPPPEAMGGGVGLLDYDGDGWLDVYVVQGGPFPSGQSSTQEGDRLFRNKGDGTFEDVTERAGIAGLGRGYGHGVAVGDYDNDGKADLFITRWRSYALYRNKGDGTFEDATARAGLGGERDWPTSAAFADLDGDGDLDLYVCHYLAYDETNPRRCAHPDSPSRHDCNPLDFEALPDHVFRNVAGRFVDVTEAAGMLEHAGRGLGVVAADLDGDGRVDLYVANDMSANYLYRNLGGFRFEEVGMLSGAAASAEGGYKAGMGIACGDLDGDGRLDLAVTNYYGESTTFYRNLGGGMFADHTEAIGMAAPTRFLLGFGISFLDADNDGRLDVLSANGHVHDRRPQYPWMMPLQLLTAGASGRLLDASARGGDPFRPPHLGRGFAAGDLDNDGKLDALVVCQNEPMVYLHNRTGSANEAGHFVVLGLEGTKSNRDGVGAIVNVRAGSKNWIAPRLGGGNYQAAGDPRLHIGLGTATRLDQVEVRWPSGKIDRYAAFDADTGYLLREGADTPLPLVGWKGKRR
jgi:enediyne biosynthesis protein E4